jgi:hypothetical protein
MDGITGYQMVFNSNQEQALNDRLEAGDIINIFTIKYRGCAYLRIQVRANNYSPYRNALRCLVAE